MLIQEKKRNPRNTAAMLDGLHIVIGILVVICAVLAFVSPSKNNFLFPVIFWLAAVLNFVNGWSRLQSGGKHNRKKMAGVVLLWAVAAFLAVVGFLSAVSVWR